MGFNVIEARKLVTVDHSHNHYANTKIDDNPTTKKYQGTTITSIFKRTKSKKAKGSLGDNCPIIYALKGIHNLKTTYGDIKILLHHFDIILGKYIEQTDIEWDCIIPMPSTHNLAKILAKRINRSCPKARLEYNALIKITASEAKSQLSRANITSKEKTQLNNYIKQFTKYHGWQSNFQMKSIANPRLRTYINPLRFNKFQQNSPPRRILLVDDMVTSGSTLNYAKSLIKKTYPMTTISILTIFSGT